MRTDRGPDNGMALLDRSPEMTWISVDERLPEKNASVLVFCGSDKRPSDQRVFCVAQWWDTYVKALWHESLTGERMIHGVTHWMPLPEPPE